MGKLEKHAINPLIETLDFYGEYVDVIFCIMEKTANHDEIVNLQLCK